MQVAWILMWDLHTQESMYAENVTLSHDHFINLRTICPSNIHCTSICPHYNHCDINQVIKKSGCYEALFWKAIVLHSVVGAMTWAHAAQAIYNGHSEPAPTSATWRMDGKWSGNRFLLGASSLAIHGGKLSCFVLLHTY
jgi:hypothetical protein